MVYLNSLHKITCFGELKNPLYYCKDTGDLYRFYPSNGPHSTGVQRLVKLGGNNKAIYHTAQIGNKTVKIHQIIAMEFLGHVPNGKSIVVDHIDGDRHNNRVENLQIVTTRHNIHKSSQFDNKIDNLPRNIIYSVKDKLYMVKFHVKGVQYHFGCSKLLQDAVKLRQYVEYRLLECGHTPADIKTDLGGDKRYKKAKVFGLTSDK